jgi:Peptidase family M23
MPRRHRTTARGLLVLILVGVFAGTARAASVPPLTAFPVVGNVTYIDDFGAPRPGGTHQGIDIMSIRHQPAVAFEAGRVEKWPGSGGCMLVLNGGSGMVYWYIHLNNDLGRTNDNLGGCKNGVAYASGLRNGQWVRRGQLVGFVGDSGDANGIQPHLHFEIHTPGGRRLNPYTYLKQAQLLLYPRPATADPIWLALKKATVVSTGEEALRIRTNRIRVSSWSWSYARTRRVLLTVPAEALLERVTSTGRTALTLSALRAGMVVWVRTAEFAPSWRTQRAPAGVLAAAMVTLR